MSLFKMPTKSGTVSRALPCCGCVVTLGKLGSESMIDIKTMWAEKPYRVVDELAKACVVSIDGVDVNGTPEARSEFHEWWSQLDSTDRHLMVGWFNDVHYPSKDQTEGFQRSETRKVTG